ncbi:MAG: ABC transporter substrate-binding protein [Verrucomicrobia bacterium]|nr:ABC transporter substrate-binding protein [Verrucomicrobiota bacterium]
MSTKLKPGLLAICFALPLCGVCAGAADELRLGHFPNLTHAQAVYARAGGQFETKIGVPVKWSSFNAGPTAIEALFTDAVDATFVGPNPAINGHLKSRGDCFTIIAGSASGGAGLVLRKDGGIRTERDFDGKIIATPQLGNTQDVAARVWFAGRGYKFREKGGTLTLLPLSNPDQLTLFQKKEIHGAWTVEPWLSRLELEGGGELFLDEKTLWPEGRHVITHLVVRNSFLAENPKLIRNLLAALVEVTQQINADKVAAAKVLNAELKRETGKPLREEVIARAMERVEFTWDPISASLHTSAESAHKIGFLRSAPNLKGIYSLGPLNEVLKEKNLPAVRE